MIIHTVMSVFRYQSVLQVLLLSCTDWTLHTDTADTGYL